MRLRAAAKLVGFPVAACLMAAALISSSAHAQTASSLTCSPSIIAGGSGNSATCTITLSAAAPAGGTVVTLASSLLELAATLPQITVPAGQTSATFTVATNSGYRPYSGLGFDATISATANGTTRSTVVSVTAQPKPADFSSGAQAGSQAQWDGLMCGGIAPIGGEHGILYSCSKPGATGFGTCTFAQECSLGCKRVPPAGTTFNDFCATTGPNAVSITRNFITSGDRVPSSIVLEAPAGHAVDQETGVPATRDVNFNSSFFPHAGGIVFPTNATTVPFDVATSYVPAIGFVDVVGFWFNQSIPPFLITNGRAGHVWLVMTPPNPAPAVPIPTLGDFQITGFNPIVGGNTTIGQIDMSGLSRAGGPTFTVSSSNPAVVPTQTFTAPANSNLFGFQATIQTQPTSADTNVTVTATDGRYHFSGVLTVRANPPPPVLSGVSVNPSSVVGGNASTGTVTLSAPQTGATTVALSTPAPTTVAKMPASVTVPAGATSASFTITTSPVTSQFNMNIFADLAGSPGQSALLLITPGGPATLSGVTINPTSVVGGASATGTVTLSGAAPSGGAVVALSKSFSNAGVTGTVPATIPASVTVPAGQATASFAIGTSAVTATTSVRISATFNGTTTAADMTLFPLLAGVAFDGNANGGSPISGTVTLSGPAPSGGTVVTLSSANPSVVTVPASVTIPAGQTSVAFTATTAPVTQTTSVNVSASSGGTTVSTSLFVFVSAAPSSVTLSPASLVGPASSTATVTLASAAPNGNAVVTLASSNTVFAVVPNSVSVPAGQTRATFTVNAAQVTSTTTVSISATYQNVTKSATLTINPQGAAGPTLSAVSLNPSTVVGGSSSTGTVTLSAAAPAGGASVSLSDNSASATVPTSVTVPAGATSATFTVTTTSVTASTVATISAVFAGVTQTAGLTVNPPAATGPSLSTVSVNPSTVVGGNSSTGTVTLTAAAPAGGASVALSDNSASATVPASVTVPAGATTANFTITTTSVTASTSATVSAVFAGVTRTAVLTVNPAAPPPGQAATLTVTATGRSGERVTSNPAGISVAVGSTGSASFTTGASITLSATNGRDVVWSGACSSGGDKTKTCTFTISANASVTANVQ